MTDNAPPNDDPYRDIAELYDLEHNDFDDDIHLFLNHARAVGDPILELGCGSGRILVPLAEAGFDVTGVDSSRPMLDRAEQAIADAGVADRVTLFEGDMRRLDDAPGGPFGLVIFSLNSLMHLTTPDDQRSALESAYRSLDPRGQLIIDTFNPSVEQVGYLTDGPHLEGSWILDDDTVVDKWSRREYSEKAQVLDTLLWYDRLMDDGRVHRTRSAFEMRYVHASELALILELCGFVDPQFYGSYEMDQYMSDSERLIVTAEVTPSPHHGN